ncbi:hypothetical protein [Winogradskyella sp. Asnod2-B02-A]|uniref:hypothetical protein n=1 Tax=Winogradskyella sp. Asnod2-B02-A TaxID=3160583 RepID=UPI00386EE0DA
MTKYLLIALLLFTSFAFSQSVEKTELIGLWNVVNVESTREIKKEEKEMLDMAKKAFMNSTFEFESNENFTLNIDFIGIGEKLKKVYWNYSSDDSSITIESWNEHDNLMVIIVEKKNDTVFFKLRETSLTLEVEK